MPADAFYERRIVTAGKQPYAITRQDGQHMAFAGLWESFQWPDGSVLRTFTVITTAANAGVAELHDRMPLILEPADWPVWLGETDGLSRHAASSIARGDAASVAGGLED